MRERIIYVGKWHAVPDRIDIDSGLSKEARAVWHNFAAHASRGGGRFFPDRDQQSAETGFGKNSVAAGRKELMDNGYLVMARETGEGRKFRRCVWLVMGEPGDASGFEKVDYAGIKKAKKQEVNTDPVQQNESKAIIEVFDAFRETGLWPIPSYDNKSQRKAADSMIRRFGAAATVDMVRKYAAAADSDKYMPKGHRPSLFLDNLGAITARMKMRAKDDGTAPVSDKVGVLHDGTEVVRKYGRWVDKNNESVTISLSYYPEAAADSVLTAEVWNKEVKPLPSDSRKKRYQELTGASSVCKPKPSVCEKD